MKLSVQLTQSPVILQPCRSDVRHMATLTGTVTISTRRARVVHGLEVVWEVYHQTRKDVKEEKWEKERSLETYSSSVLEGKQMVREGGTTLPFLIQVPSGLLPTRKTQYDRISHALHAVVLNPAPKYGHRGAASSWIKPLSWDAAGPSRIGPFDRSHLSAVSRTDIEVLTASSTEARYTHFTWRESIEALGNLEVVATTEALALAAPVDMHVTLSTLPVDIRLQAVTVQLCQRTESPDSKQFYEDRYTLMSAGSVHEAKDAINTDTFYHVNSTFHLPSPVIGALATSSPQAKEHPIARISHTIEVSVHYLRTDSPPGAKMDLWTGSRSICLESDIPSTHHNPPPPYVKDEQQCASAPPAAAMDPVLEINATKVPRWTSVQFFDHFWMRPVKLEPHVLQRCTRHHWQETGGMCRCFNHAGLERTPSGPGGPPASAHALRVKT